MPKPDPNLAEESTRRNARLIALMAANSFLLFFIYQHHNEIVLQSKTIFSIAITAGVSAVLCGIGLLCAYVALWLKPKDKGAMILEIVSAFPLGYIGSSYLGFFFRSLFFS